MNPLALLTGYVVLGLVFILLSPLVGLIAALDWCRSRTRQAPGGGWHHGRPHDARTAWDHEED